MTRRTITTDATGRREASPEVAVVEVTAIGDGDSATVARRNARDRAATVQESLVEQVVSAAQIDAVEPAAQIDAVELRVEDSSQAFDPDTDAPYRAVETLHVDCAPETAREVVVVATDAGGTVPTVRFDLREDVRHRLQEEALAAAMERAREKAERLASTEGLEVGGVRDITSQEGSTGMSSIVDEALATSRTPDLRPEPVVVSESVEVVYELADDRVE